MKMTITDRVFGRQGMVQGLDSVTDMLSNQRRRTLIKAIEDDERLTLKEAAERIAREECEGDGVDASEKNRIYISLHQCHLPRMDDHNVVEYDSSRKIINVAEGYHDTKRALEKLESLYR